MLFQVNSYNPKHKMYQSSVCSSSSRLPAPGQTSGPAPAGRPRTLASSWARIPSTSASPRTSCKYTNEVSL